MNKKIEKTISLDVFTWEELDPNIQALINRAKASAEKAYAPYSNFLVGAAILLENGEIITGNNQENISFPAGICAERDALSYAQANYPTIRLKKIVIVGKKREKESYADITPCGICRQTISEYEQKFKHPIEIYLLSQNGEILKANSMDDLLPFKFNDF